jgi:hypothetical protein
MRVNNDVSWGSNYPQYSDRTFRKTGTSLRTNFVNMRGVDYFVLFDKLCDKSNSYFFEFWRQVELDAELKDVSSEKKANSTHAISSVISILYEFISDHSPDKIVIHPLSKPHSKLYLYMASRFRDRLPKNYSVYHTSSKHEEFGKITIKRNNEARSN